MQKFENIKLIESEYSATLPKIKWIWLSTDGDRFLKAFYQLIHIAGDYQQPMKIETAPVHRINSSKNLTLDDADYMEIASMIQNEAGFSFFDEDNITEKEFEKIKKFSTRLVKKIKGFIG